MIALKKKGSNMSIFNKFTVAMSVVVLSAVGGGLVPNVHAEEVKQDTKAVKTASVDTTSEGAITEKAKLVILGIDKDGKLIPTGEERITYLKAQNYDYQKVQDKVNELLSVIEPVYIVNEQTNVQVPTQAPVVQESAPVQNTTGTYSTSNGFTVGSAKEAIAMAESGGSYTATNGQYIGRYQLSSSYLGGDYSAANQERVADNYVAQRYGSWEAAWAFHQANGWY